MSDTTSPPPAPGPAWPLRATALLLVVLGVYPLADHLGLADPQQWWRRAWHAWALWSPLMLLALLLARDNTEKWAERAERGRRALLALPPARFALLAGLLTTALSLWIGWIMFAWQGVTIDEQSELWQAHILMSGRLFALAEPHAEFFSTMQTVSFQGRWFAHFPIGGPALQALGLLLRAPELINPLLAGCAAVAFYGFASATGEETEARGATLLLAFSPFILIIAGSRLDHAATLAAIWLALAALPAWLSSTTDTASYRASVVIGLALGVATMVRPYDGAIATLVVGGFQLRNAGRRGQRWRALAVQALAGAIPIALLLGVNRALTGHPLTFAYDVLNGPDHRPGFHMSPLGFEHTPLTGLYRTSAYVMRVNGALLGWPVPAIAIAALAMLLWRPVTRWDRLLVALLVGTLAAYALYWGDGSFHGPRFLYVVMPVFLLYIARFPAALRQRLRGPVPRTAVLLLIPLWFGAAWLLPASRLQPFSPWNATVGSREADPIPDLIVDTARRRHLRHALVFVEDGWHARLTARMRALGIAPYRAQLLVGNYNACTLQQRLDEIERRGIPREPAVRWLESVMAEPLDSRPVPGLSALEQLALPGASTPPAPCRWDFDHAKARGVDFARLLPYIALDSLGRLGGDVVYARDFGARNELLRDRFGDREWYRATPELSHDTLRIALEPWVPPGRTVSQAR